MNVEGILFDYPTKVYHEISVLNPRWPTWKPTCLSFGAPLLDQPQARSTQLDRDQRSFKRLRRRREVAWSSRLVGGSWQLVSCGKIRKRMDLYLIISCNLENYSEVGHAYAGRPGTKGVFYSKRMEQWVFRDASLTSPQYPQGDAKNIVRTCFFPLLTYRNPALWQFQVPSRNLA